MPEAQNDSIHALEAAAKALFIHDVPNIFDESDWSNLSDHGRAELSRVSRLVIDAYLDALGWEWSGESAAFPGTSVMQVYPFREQAETALPEHYRLTRRRPAGSWEAVS